ncbi:E3 ubiquitin-protein ligase siah-1-like [Centruroides sculpturatus]|uniref:E3 ubiquitin-protein ligase siah-1-like n=1 Tax=Centruroides sculpturatus TaxID=218467 RepID=UPI000C6E6E0A|nr:E3 ubiquitin-protein ligase siah-1-like [Centruroides sculpturatus]
MVPFALFTYNTTVHSSTNDPYYLVYGSDPVFPFDVVTEPSQPSYDVSENYASELRARLALAHRLAQKHAEKAAQDRKVYHDRKNKPHKFVIGDRVFVTQVVVPTGLKRKLLPRWQGPILPKSEGKEMEESSNDGNNCEEEKTPASPTTLNENPTIISLMECPVCYENLVAPIFQCMAGHLLCGSCRGRVHQ